MRPNEHQILFQNVQEVRFHLPLRKSRIQKLEPIRLFFFLQLLRITEDILERASQEEGEGYGKCIGKVYMKKVSSIVFFFKLKLRDSEKYNF